MGARVQALILKLGESKGAEIYSFRVKCLNFYVEYCKQVLVRVDFNDPVLQSFPLLGPQQCKSDETMSIIPLGIRLPNVIDEGMYEQLDREWRLIKTTSDLNAEDNFFKFWNKVFGIKNDIGQLMFPTITGFVKAL